MNIATTECGYEPGARIYRQGDTDNAIYILHEGVVEILKSYSEDEPVPLRLVVPGEGFGSLTFTGLAVQRTWAVAVAASRVIKVPKIFLKRAIFTQPAAAVGLFDFLEHELSQTEELAESLMPRRTKARLAILLCILARKFSEDHDGRPRIGLSLTQRELAVMVSSTRESVCKAINEMRRRELIKDEKGFITILQPDELMELGSR